MTTISNFDTLPKYPSDEQIVEDVSAIHNEDALFSNEVKQLIGIKESEEEEKESDFYKIKELVIRNQSLKEFLDDIEIKFKTNIDRKEAEIKSLAEDLKQLRKEVVFQK